MFKNVFTATLSDSADMTDPWRHLLLLDINYITGYEVQQLFDVKYWSSRQDLSPCTVMQQ